MNFKKLGIAAIGLAVLFITLAGFRRPDPPYLVEVIVVKEGDTTCQYNVEVMEIWSDRSHVLRCIGVGERKDNKCAPSAHCTSNEINCSVLPAPVGGSNCDYCTAGSANNSMCWPVTGIVCSTVQGEDYTCGTRMRATCVVPPVGDTTCTGGTPTNQGTCNLEGCTTHPGG